ncbi:MAG TPA: hypothetical protein VFB80_06860, partial [Pirellulaceae bacterium]|nr:hypothetical protein [Pirellulaceae bacterium]
MARLSRTRRKSSSPAAVIRTDAGAEIPVPGGPVLQEFAIRWAYLIRNRTHWNKTKWAAMRSQLQRQVKSVGFRQADFRKL